MARRRFLNRRGRPSQPHRTIRRYSQQPGPPNGIVEWCPVSPGPGTLFSMFILRCSAQLPVARSQYRLDARVSLHFLPVQNGDSGIPPSTSKGLLEKIRRHALPVVYV